MYEQKLGGCLKYVFIFSPTQRYDPTTLGATWSIASVATLVALREETTTLWATAAPRFSVFMGGSLGVDVYGVMGLNKKNRTIAVAMG